MASIRDLLFIGIKGHVLALDRATGDIRWYTPLKGSDFVNVILDGDQVLAATKGEMFCLDATSGALKWQNYLKGFGTGFITIATVNAPGQGIVPQQKKARDDEAAAAASSAAD
jgi:hypothetical protein